LEPSITTLKNGDLISVKHELVLSIIDGKVCNSIPDNRSTQKLYICGVGSEDMNNLNMIKQRPIIDTSTLSFRLSFLHAWIRFLNVSSTLHSD